jgi:hypothetical protein
MSFPIKEDVTYSFKVVSVEPSGTEDSLQRHANSADPLFKNVKFANPSHLIFVNMI